MNADGSIMGFKRSAQKKEGSVICWLDYRTWKHSMWCRGSCCITSSLCDPGTQFDTAPEDLHLRNESIFAFVLSQTPRPDPSAPPQWSLLSLARAEEKAGDAGGKREERLRALSRPRRRSSRPYPTAFPFTAWDRSSPSGWILRATCKLLQSWNCSSHSRDWAAETRICYINDLFQLNLRANSPSLTGQGRKLPSLYSSVHLFYLCWSRVSQDHSNEKPVSFLFGKSAETWCKEKLLTSHNHTSPVTTGK